MGNHAVLRLALVALLLNALGCDPGAPPDGDPAPGTDAGPLPPGTDAGPLPPGVDAGPLPPGTDAGRPAPGTDAGPPVGSTGEFLGPAGTCLAWNQRVYRDGSGAWVEETCGGGAGCVRGECVTGQCTDECVPGERRSGSECELYDMLDDEWVGRGDAGGSMEDRARAFENYIQEFDHNGMLGYDRGDWTYMGDSALWTGLQYAAEGYRLQATGSDEAREQVRRLTESLHIAANVYGSRGLLVRFFAPSSEGRWESRYHVRCGEFVDHEGFTRRHHHCNIDYEGTRYNMVADPSRDMYIGPMLGWAAAYRGLTGYDEELRRMIRDDVVAIVDELITRRTMNVKFIVNGTDLGTHEVEARFMIPEPRVQRDGAVVAQIDTGDLGDSGLIEGAQEFFPNPAAFFKQPGVRDAIPILGPLLIDAVPEEIPRSSSAVMVMSFLQVGMLVTRGVPGYEEYYRKFHDFYHHNDDEYGNADDWARMAGQWSDDRECGERYFGRNLVFTPLLGFFDNAEPHAAREALLTGLLRGKLWPDVRTHENSWFTFIYGAATGDVGPTAQAANDLRGFPTPPLRRRSVDLRSRYSGREGGCTDQVSHDQAVDVRDRINHGFIWHDHPWGLVDRGNDDRQPGHDYLVAYWLGRAKGFVDDDRPNHCARWR